MTQRLTAQDLSSQPLQVASCLVFNEDGHILLLRRHAEDLGGGMWALPGGKQEPNEEPAVTAVREVQEETGLALDIVHFMGTHEVRMPHGAVHLHSFRAMVPNDVVVRTEPDEHDEHRWFTPSELLSTPQIIWALPTILRDYGFMEVFEIDPTLQDGSEAILLPITPGV